MRACVPTVVHVTLFLYWQLRGMLASNDPAQQPGSSGSGSSSSDRSRSAKTQDTSRLQHSHGGASGNASSPTDSSWWHHISGNTICYKQAKWKLNSRPHIPAQTSIEFKSLIHIDIQTKSKIKNEQNTHAMRTRISRCDIVTRTGWYSSANEWPLFFIFLVFIFMLCQTNCINFVHYLRRSSWFSASNTVPLIVDIDSFYVGTFTVFTSLNVSSV